MKPTHKLNGGIGATLCKSCSIIINTGFTDELLCTDCQEKAIELLDTFRDDAIQALDGTWDRSNDGFKSQIHLINNFINFNDEES